MTRTPTAQAWTRAELEAEAEARFGTDPRLWSFVCPACDDVADPGDFLVAGADPNAIGQECLGRHLGALERPKPPAVRGCDWVAYGLIPGPWRITVPAYGADGTLVEPGATRDVSSFPLAPHSRDSKRTPAERDAVAAAWEARVAARGPVTDRDTGEPAPERQ